MSLSIAGIRDALRKGNLVGDRQRDIVGFLLDNIDRVSDALGRVAYCVSPQTCPGGDECKHVMPEDHGDMKDCGQCTGCLAMNFLRLREQGADPCPECGEECAEHDWCSRHGVVSGDHDCELTMRLDAAIKSQNEQKAKEDK